MMRSLLPGALALAALSSAPLPASAAGVVSHISVTSDKVQDVSSLEAWKQSFIKPGMTDQEKAIAIWRSAVMFRHQDIPANEYMDNEAHPHDPIEVFNVYGYGQCCCASANVETLARYIGLDARGWGITGHSVPEVRIDGHWCMLDASLINYFKKPDGSIASVEEISGSITQWYAQHPELRNDNDKLYKFMVSGAWKSGPEIVSGGTGYDGNGWLPAGTHGWYSSMQEFGHASQNFIYDYGCAPGYEVNIQLRPGEKLVRSWSNKGLHVNMLDGEAPGVMNCVIGKDQMRYSAAMGDLAPGRVGNGTVEYTVPLAQDKLEASALSADNLASAADGKSIGVKDEKGPGSLVLRMPSSYVYLGGEVSFQMTAGPGSSIAVSLSDNNGLDWKPVGSFNTSGSKTLDLKPLIFRRYDYRLRFLLQGAAKLSALRIAETIQHSQRPLPALHAGDNQIHFSAGAQEGTVTVQGLTDKPEKPKNLLFTDFHPQLENVSEHNLQLTGGKGQLVVPIETAGEITRLRIGAHYRARDVRDGWTISASFDSGKTYLPIGQLEGGFAGCTRYLTFDKVPTGSKTAMVRFEGTQRNTTLILDLRICADYREPHGGFAPVQVTYAWDEGGQPRQDVHVLRSPDESYLIHCHQKPVMKSIAMELAQ